MGLQGRLVKYNKTITGIIVGTVVTGLMGSDTEWNLQDLFNKTFSVYNGGPAPLAAGVVEVAPDSAGPWATLIAVAGGTLGSATVWNYQVTNDTYAFYRIRAAVASGSVATAQVYARF